VKRAKALIEKYCSGFFTPNAGIELTLDICRRHEIEPVFYYPCTTFDFRRCFQDRLPLQLPRGQDGSLSCRSAESSEAISHCAVTLAVNDNARGRAAG
jgi:hypothetical protein